MLYGKLSIIRLKGIVISSKVLPSQLRPSAFSLYPLPQSQVKDPGTFTHSCSHMFDVLLWHSSTSKREKK